MAGLLRPAQGGKLTQPFGPTRLSLEPRGWFVEQDPGGLRRTAVGAFPGGVAHRHVHPGIDIGLPRGTPLVAVEAGEIHDLGTYASTGERFLLLRIRPGVFAFYTHLRALRCEKGQAVARGQVVALSGNSGISTGPHLHFEIRRREDGRLFRYDPRRLFRGRDLAAEPWILPPDASPEPLPLPQPAPEDDMPPLLEYVPGSIATVKPPAAIRRAPSTSASLVRELVDAERPLVIGWVRGGSAFGSDRWLMWGTDEGSYEFTHEVNVEAVTAPDLDCSDVVQAAVDAALAAQPAGTAEPERDDASTERAHDLI